MRIVTTVLVGFIATLMLASSAIAHSLGEGYLLMRIADTTLEGWFEITVTDIDLALDLDADGDGKVDDDEINQRIDEIRDYLFSRLGVGSNGEWYPFSYTRHEVRDLPQSRFLAIYFDIGVPGAVPDELDLRYEVLFDVDSEHRGFLVVAENAKTGVINKGEDTALRFAPDERVHTLNVNELSRWSTFTTFVGHGTWHIWIGIDHILFLLALILPAVLIRREGRWRAVHDFAPALWQVVKIVTLFTIAHTITLSMAALGIVALPSRVVESVIAASVVIAALNNVYPILRDNLGYVVFGFGLFHGFGFASVLSHLITNRSNLVVDLLGFNLGVELGQIAIIVLAFPILFAIRHTAAYLRVLVPVGSLAIAALGAGWLVERALGFEFMPL